MTVVEPVCKLLIQLYMCVISTKDNFFILFLSYFVCMLIDLSICSCIVYIYSQKHELAALMLVINFSTLYSCHMPIIILLCYALLQSLTELPCFWLLEVATLKQSMY